MPSEQRGMSPEKGKDLRRLLLSYLFRREGMKVARASNRLGFYTIDGDTTYLPLHNVRMELHGREILSCPPAAVVSAATNRKTFERTDLTSTYSVCTQVVFGGIKHRTQAPRSGVRSFNHKATHDPRRPLEHLKMWNEFVSQFRPVYENDPTLFLTALQEKDLDNEWLPQNWATAQSKTSMSILRAAFPE
ncbi:hypothetical protein TNCV_2070341 [Trichonephila clavipes]|uniref:Uncharacterized protein n=1 Tax=Trichonephila clavipes TaxID=2585209 RepID=A0A8X6W3E8_TRICX|nr:hypothetical protein TNCV_2070341 [Trichonephila clavipes]